jgi:hypothetical protein
MRQNMKGEFNNNIEILKKKVETLKMKSSISQILKFS